MNIEEVKRNINQKVLYPLYGKDTEYILLACILRKNNAGFFYQAEIKDLKANSVLIVKIEDIKPIGG